jgi:hypothetical protein
MCNLEERDHLQEIGVNGKIIPKWIFKKLVGTWDWIILALDKDRWWVHVNAVMNIRVP